MGLFDSIKNVFGGKPGTEADVTASPSQMLREAGIDPEGLKMTFGSDGSIAVSGQVNDESERRRIIDTLSSAPGVARVDDRMSIAPSTAEEPAPAPAPEAAKPEATEAKEDTQPAVAASGGRTYTVQSGDTLWKIAEQLCGSGSKYMKIFEANTDLLDHPDRIFPGQVLKIPDLGNS
jgi:nucleoid-associated protein YgaU